MLVQGVVRLLQCLPDEPGGGQQGGPASGMPGIAQGNPRSARPAQVTGDG